LVSNFAVKFPGEKSDFDLHQGINFIDETKGNVSITMWIPLQDVNLDNGNMQVVRGSHKFFKQDVRSQHYQTPYENIKPYIKDKYVENLPMKAGEAWIFNHRLLHCSPVNKTNKVRIATLNIMVPEESPVILYYKDSENVSGKKVEILEFTEDNYFLQNVQDMSKTPGIINKGKTEELHYQISKEEFDELYEKKYHK
jgi:ectoine hydroxylase-related dioxygenase (phytanoyl-CoA dioxygenase family)